ncbi:hypothetical protein FRACA_3300005 [Frankia canadensis]|uniref:Uncharacterized protein n=1 Tax=Frankia canadensis TaxID=1836972 RepID=A0A2I2KUV6_9ACTN|nr:hypothetical protein FRACA_3300005 [Frankia canadensis]SOU56734.1 hypothetical protein FRACA_3300005 [Frankia canadensis]
MTTVDGQIPFSGVVYRDAAAACVVDGLAPSDPVVESEHAVRPKASTAAHPATQRRRNLETPTSPDLLNTVQHMNTGGENIGPAMLLTRQAVSAPSRQDSTPPRTGWHEVPFLRQPAHRAQDTSAAPSSPPEMTD